ncbi:unnamed protein product [Lasius platythorax]|uniref:RNase H type-1 domain-containing protein n=1 Tax=Lasius platythorax TaxID=488582 RepID=A0AAV2NPQ0_9HYME
MSAIAKTTMEFSVVWDYMHALEKQNQISLAWTPGYQGIADNEKTNKLAKLRSEMDPGYSIVDIPFVTDKNIIRGYLKLRIH